MHVTRKKNGADEQRAKQIMASNMQLDNGSRETLSTVVEPIRMSDHVSRKKTQVARSCSDVMCVRLCAR